VLRVFRYAAQPNPFALDPWGYSFQEMYNFTEFCGERGFYVDWTCGDAQIVLPEKDGPKGQQQHQNQTCATLAQIPCFIERCNQPFKNGVSDEVVVPQWGVYLRDTGNYGESKDWPWPVLDFGSYHGTREDQYPTPYLPKWVVD